MQNTWSKALKSHLYSSIPFFKMNKSVVFQFLHSFKLPKLGERLFKKLLSNWCGQFPYKEHLHLCRQSTGWKGATEKGCSVVKDIKILPSPWPRGLARRPGQPTLQSLDSPKPWPCHSLGAGGLVQRTCGPHTPRNRNLGSSSCHLAGGIISPLGDPL